MMMARHDNVREQLVPLVREVQQRLLNDLGLTLVGKVRHRTLSVEQPIDLREKQLLFVVFPLVIGHASWLRSRLKLLSKLAYLL